MALEGWLVKRARVSGRNWKRRYFVLRGNELSYYATIPAARNPRRAPKGSVTPVETSHTAERTC